MARPNFHSKPQKRSKETLSKYALTVTLSYPNVFPQKSLRVSGLCDFQQPQREKKHGRNWNDTVNDDMAHGHMTSKK